jgi:UDP:flavonoid glycosyltransferase YjiC (YdhE family)
MKVTILALGSRGDIVPLVVLGGALLRAGHGVRLATFENFEGMVRAAGLDYWPVRGDSQSMLNAGAGLALSESGHNVVRMWVSVMRSFGVMARSFAQDFVALAKEKTDLIINQLPIGLYGIDLAQKLDVPMITAAVIPMTPTRAFPMLAFPTRFGRSARYNLLTYRVAQQSVWQWYRPAINQMRRSVLGLPKWPVGGYFGQMEQAGTPVINGFSSQVVPRPADWGDHVHISGYWFGEEETWRPSEDAWRLPGELVRFLETGPPPIFIGFGSMPIRDPAGTTGVILEALRQSGRRGVVQAGWAGIAGRELPDHVLKIDYAPYEWLFPRMAAVVHHGGSGTTAHGLRAGVPSIIVPFLFDQFFWGRRVHELGVGPEAIPFKKLTAGRLAQAIDVVVTDKQMRHLAAELGRVIEAEGGLNRAVQIVQSVV